MTRTHCPYCALQCGMTISGTREAPVIAGDADFHVTRGEMCVKGWSAGATLAHAERLRAPLVRDASGALVPATWDEALDRIAQGVSDAQARGGREAVGVFGSGALTNEKAYLLGKLARVALRTPHVDYNGRYCMSSASAALTRAFGVDRGLPFPLEDLADADIVVILGGNPAETMPPLLRVLDAQRARGGRLVVVDPRETPTAARATHHLRPEPGTDGALANGLLHVLVREGLVDDAYVRERTRGFSEASAVAAGYWPERVEKITGVPEAALVEVARALGRASRVAFLSGRGHEQQARGVTNVLAFINVALAIGAPGRPFSGFGALTGQGNGQGGREHGQKADQLPGFRRIDDPAARAHVARVWGVDPGELPGPGRSAQELLATAGTDGGVRALLVVGSNVAVSAADAASIQERLRALDFLCVVDFFLSETAALAHVVLPSAQWAEEEGTMTNLEGRVLRRRRAFAPPDGVRTDLEILCAVAARLGHAARFPSSEPRDVFDELRRASEGGAADYSAITYERIDAEGGVTWGPSRLFLSRFPTADGRAVFHPTPWEPPAETPDAAYPLYLTTGRLMMHYQSGTQTRRTPALRDAAGEPTVQVHPRTAERHEVRDGDVVTLVTRRGRARLTVRVSVLLREDTVFVPFHWGGEASVNRLTHAALDPISRMPELKVCAVRMERGSTS
jgi:assimilatory nitrate reductase catalytic subunit